MVNGTTWQNLFINGVNGTLIPPGNLTTALTAINATALESVLATVQVPSSNGTNETVVDSLQNAQGITVFIPANDAFTSDVNTTLQGLQSNTSALQAIIQNHVRFSLAISPHPYSYMGDLVHQRHDALLDPDR